MSSDRNWREYNDALVRRGEVLLDLECVSSWSREIDGMNEGKEGARYRYPETFMRLLATVHALLLPYRQLEGFTRALTMHIDGMKAPDFTSIAWRVKRMDIQLDDSVRRSHEDVVVILDATGIKVHNRGDWLRRKMKLRKGLLKMHLAVDVKSRQILAMEVTKEDVHDSEMLEPLVEKASSLHRVEKVLADGGYDSRENFSYLDKTGIEPVIKVRKDSLAKAFGCHARKLSAIEQMKNYKAWKRGHGYNMRLSLIHI